ncbi:MAG TPA: hypothetical protein VFC79_12695, partial [Tissierellaceae bacterium]|nr:hypothetical protein [Tissierellaceae bacterium]
MNNKLKLTLSLILALVMVIGGVASAAELLFYDGTTKTSYTDPMTNAEVDELVAAFDANHDLAKMVDGKLVNYNAYRAAVVQVLADALDDGKTEEEALEILAAALPGIIAALDEVLIEEEITVESVEAKNKTTLEVTTTDGVKHLITEFTPSPLTPGLETEVTFTFNGEEYVELVTYDAGKLMVIANRVDLIKASNNKDLKLDGTTVLRIEAEIIDSDTGEVDKDFVGQAEFVSQYGLKAAHALTAFDNGKATFNVSLPSKDEIVNDKVTIVLREHENQELRGLTSEPMYLTYYPYDPVGEPSEETRKAYTVDSVRSLDLADRVAVYVSNVNEDDKDDIEEAILKQIKVYNNKDLANDVAGIFVNPIDLVKIVEVKPLPGAFNSYVFTVLVDLKDYDADGYNRIDQITGAALIDNQYNYYEIKEAPVSQLIYLNPKAPSIDNKFMVKDSRVPRIEKIVAPRVVDGEIDESYLPAKTLLAEFNEAVARLSAEKPENWVINGNKLSEADVNFIRVIDYDEVGTISGKAFDDYSAIKTRKTNRPRTSVIISLTHRAEREYLKGNVGQPMDNLIQVRSVTDVAGLSDLSDNNKITTQNFIFEYTRPESKTGLGIEIESPEQYVLELYEDLYTDDESGSLFDITTSGAIKVELLSTTNKTLVKELDNDDYRIVGLGPDEEGYILELTEDWTVLLNGLTGNPAYHNKWFRVTITETIYDYYGNLLYEYDPVTGEEEDEDEDNEPMYAEVQVPEDVTSPAIADLDFTGAENVNGTWTYTQDTFAPIFMEFNEPVQIITDYNGDVVSHMAPSMTPSLEQGTKVPTPTFEYVAVDSKYEDATVLDSAGVRIPGYIDEDLTPVDEHDTKLHVKAEENLEVGLWKLVVREMSDDVGNTMSTEQYLFEVIEGEVTPPEGDNIIDPYVIWAYADDDYEEEDGTYNDYVYILYSRQMHIDAIRAETYDINGKQLDQDADITSESVVLYRQNCDSADPNYNKYYGLNADPIMNEWVGQLVTIKLPEDFIIGGDDMDGDRDDNWRKNVLTIPRSVKADDDGVEETEEKLLFGNNGGSNTFELTFFNDEIYDVKYLDVCGLGGLYQPTLRYHTPMNYFEYLAGEEVDPDEVDKTALTDLIAVAEGLDEADYEDDAAWAALPAAIAAAQVVADDEDATQDEVDQAVLDLQAAIDALDEVVVASIEATFTAINEVAG